MLSRLISFGKICGSMGSGRRAFALTFTAFVIVACTKKAPVTSASALAEATEGVNCSAVSAPTEPELMAWDASARAELTKLRQKGVVAVRYEAKGCDVSLELLPNCIGPKNRYVYSPFSTSTTKIAKDKNELFTQLPLGAANVASRLKDHRAIRTDTKLVGTVGLPAGSTVNETDFVGPECKRATHLVSMVYVGGFAMADADIHQISATNLFELPQPREGMTREGYAQICQRSDAEKIELPGCAIPVRVALLPFHSAGPAPVGPAPVVKSTEPSAVEEGPFDQSAIERIVRDRHGAVKRKCWDTVTDPNVKKLDVTIVTTVGKDGRVAKADAQVTDSEGPADVVQGVAKCVSTEVQAWGFPRPDQEKVVNLPFHLLRQRQ